MHFLRETDHVATDIFDLWPSQSHDDMSLVWLVARLVSRDTWPFGPVWLTHDMTITIILLLPVDKPYSFSSRDSCLLIQAGCDQADLVSLDFTVLRDILLPAKVWPTVRRPKFVMGCKSHQKSMGYVYYNGTIRCFLLCTDWLNGTPIKDDDIINSIFNDQTRRTIMTRQQCAASSSHI